MSQTSIDMVPLHLLNTHLDSRSITRLGTTCKQYHHNNKDRLANIYNELVVFLGNHKEHGMVFTTCTPPCALQLKMKSVDGIWYAVQTMENKGLTLSLTTKPSPNEIILDPATVFPFLVCLKQQIDVQLSMTRPSFFAYEWDVYKRIHDICKPMFTRFAHELSGGHKKISLRYAIKKLTHMIPSTAAKSVGGGLRSKGRKVYRGMIEGVTNDAIKRLAHVGGVKSMSKSIYAETRGIVRYYLEYLLKNVIAIAKHKNVRGMITTKTVLHAMETLPRTMFKKVYTTNESTVNRCKLFAPEPTKTKRKPGDLAIQAIRYYQKTYSECVHIAKEAFARLVKEISQDFSTDQMFEAKALVIMQYSLEAFLIGFFADTQLVAIHAGRQKVMPKDMQLVISLRSRIM